MSAPRPAWIGQSIRGAERRVIRNVVIAAVATAGAILLFTVAAHTTERGIITCNQQGCSDRTVAAPSRRLPARSQIDASGNSIVIGGRPAGCPRLYCGCGLRKYLGIEDKSLDLAWNWARKFQRTTAAPGMVVVWRSHVALIEEVVGPREARLRDYNSGRGLSHIHVRSIAGAVIVNPSIRTAVLK